MKKKDFISSLKGILEIDGQELNEDTDLGGLLDSLAILSLVAFLDSAFQRRLTEHDYRSITTVKSLMQMIGSEHFNEEES